MRKYADINRDSGVAAYHPMAHGIVVRFKTGSEYEYTDTSAGRHNIERMKYLAEKGDGLNAFINTNVRKAYSRRLR